MRFIFIRNSLSIICDLHMYKTFFFLRLEAYTSPHYLQKVWIKMKKIKKGNISAASVMPEMQAGAFMWEITFREKTSIRNLKMVFFPLLFQKSRRQ